MTASRSPQRPTPGRSPHDPAEDARAGWRVRWEGAFERWGHTVCRFRWAVLSICAAFTLFCLSFVPGVTVDNSTEALLVDDDPAVVLYDEFREEFSRDDTVIVSVEAPDLFDLAFLERLRALHEALRDEVPYVDEVDSLVNARVLRGEADELVAEELLEDWPSTQAEADRARAIALANPLYEYALLSPDGTTTAIAVKPFTYSEPESFDALAGFDDEASDEEASDELVPLTAPEGDALMAAVHALVAEHERDDFQLSVAGALPMTHRINQGMNADMAVFLPATFAVMAVLLAVLFRRVSGVVLPLTIVGLSLTTTLGIMVMLGIPGSTAVQILPVFLLTVGVCDAVHILTLVYRRRAEGAEKFDAIASALGHSALAVVMTSVTTAAGMSSFITSDMEAIVHLGILAPIGVMLALVYTVTLLPALLAVFPLPVPRERGSQARGSAVRSAGPVILEKAIVAAGSFALRHPARVLLPASLIVVLLVLGALQVRFSHDGLSWFPEDDAIVRDFKKIDSALGGAVSLDILIDSREAGGIYEPWLLQAIERITIEAPAIPAEPVFIKKSTSIVDIVKETHQALNEGRPEMRIIPETRQAVAQELLLFESSGSDDTEDFVDTEFRKARVNLRVPFVNALLFPKVLDDIDALVAKRLDGRADHEITGLMTLLARIFTAVIDSMARSYTYALLVITPLMMLLLGSLRRGLVSMVPNLFPVLSVVGVMGWLDLALDSTTMMVGAMVIGIAVDDTIHFMHKFQYYFSSSGDLEGAVEETLRTTGSALLFTSLVLAGGFAIFSLGGMTNMRIFGSMAAMATLVAFFADILLTPALLALVEGARRRKASTEAPALGSVA